MKRPSLLMLLGLGAGVSVIVHGVSLTAAPAAQQAQTRMGASIQESIAQRDRNAAERTRALDMREQALRAAETRIAASAPQKQPAPPPVPAVGQPVGGANGSPANGSPANGSPMVSDPADQQIDNLARIYQTMKPARAAVVFEKLSLDVQVRIARKMRERSMALIMGAMEAEKAARLSMALAGRRGPDVAQAAARPATKSRP